MALDTNQAVRRLCLAFPGSEEVRSHGSPEFRVRGKGFAAYVINHHGDGRVALWLRMPPGAQKSYVEAKPRHFFVPPYLGPRGWLGVELQTGLSWKRIAALVRDAYEHAAPAVLVAAIGKTVAIPEPVKPLSQTQVDPLKGKRAQAVLRRLAKRCAELPETSEGTQFGSPMWRAGKKVFVSAHSHEGRVRLCFWVGPEGQAALGDDPRYRVPPYMGHNGWIALDVHSRCDWDEVDELLQTSYRRFALKRMLKKLDQGCRAKQ